MSDITIKLNGSEVTAAEGKTILEVAGENGIDIPTFCYIEELSPTGACRICVVEVEGLRTLVGSCHTPITPGMAIQTHSQKVLEARRVILDLLMTSHCGTCYMCEKANLCKLRTIATDLDVGLSRFQSKKRFYPIEDVSPYIIRDLTKCILCRKCVRACNEIAKKHVFGIGYRGFYSKIIVDFDEVLDKEVCRDCGICIPHCPTGALSYPLEITEEKKGPPLVIRG
ncbi:2Fe-2S iron-sulfur cluster-binding protein [Chloroflexota bacterium]